MASGAFEPLLLPNGTWLKNRIGKAAMEEKMSDVQRHCQPSPGLLGLYSAWGKGGAGLILSGNIMLDPTAMSCPGDVLLAPDVEPLDESRWREWVQATRSGGAQFWFQLNHPGRQIKKGAGLPVYAPSAVKMDMGSFSNMFQTPIAMTEAQIHDVISRFTWAAEKAEQLGADGVEIHAAHGYLISQFLSPLSNRRTDQWGGPLENRARLLFEVVKSVRAKVSPKFGVGVKINTADFQRGGFDVDDLFWVAKQLNNYQLDLLEISGGNYESPVMATGVAQDDKASSTARREAYFLQVAAQLKDVVQMPVMVTGGISRKAVVEEVVGTGTQLIAGVGTAMGLVPDLPNRWARGEDPAPALSRSRILPKPLAAVAKTSCVQVSFHMIGRGWRPWKGVWPVLALLVVNAIESRQMRVYKKWVHQQFGQKHKHL
ncbi:uncharacterized protein Z520_09984 [Fonsecaea multimorphosa CBS 102226]|uniref:NADH:flavin oxidoreductase/NADH oxidase N-terminal domain-containing protein n=1 Tax=Fonsecaea multimorphosa CBS 102226 TaxID=1442371 RepID=A0A0D2JUS0_9EURO|nr:uncharacterized protein Z520_09984 [Fonsecaea multimorphosa CBS 102226]KIX94274.1 hypothetical protein Z520_09984 [Fonsecaea multimorphosa CBS 102226]OAL19955.1 hypothetical protein AYO22_09482 [Fonsecaea multimorphosa]